MSLVVHAFHSSDVGRMREINEDNRFAGRTVFAVADGMGGHAAGEVASEAALGPLRAIDGTTYADPDEATNALAEAVSQANVVVLERAANDPDLRGMGTTLTTVMIRGAVMHLAHVGDSRAYLMRNGLLEMLTEDHTLVNQLVKEGRLTEEQAAMHPQRSVITRAIGVEHGVEVDTMPEPLELLTGDQILLCSDGLTGPVNETLIAEILGSEPDGDRACQRLIDAANAAGGPDNITCVLLRVEGDEAAAPAAAAPAPARAVTSDDDATADLGDPAALNARRLAQLADGGGIDDTPPQLRGRRGRRVAATILGVVVILAVLAVGGFLLLNRQFYVGVNDDGQVGIYRGVQGEVLGITLASLEEEEDFSLDDLPERLRQGLEDGIAFATLAEARSHVEDVLLPAVLESEEQPSEEPTPTPTPTPTPRPTTAPAPPPAPTPAPPAAGPAPAPVSAPTPAPTPKTT